MSTPKVYKAPEQMKEEWDAEWHRQATDADLMLDAHMFPPRFYVSKFPTSQQFAAMPQESL
jgi:hypothetical protein